MSESRVGGIMHRVLDPKDIERYRRMSVAERLRETIALMQFDEAMLAALPPAERERRLRLIEAEQIASNEALLRALAGR